MGISDTLSDAIASVEDYESNRHGDRFYRELETTKAVMRAMMIALDCYGMWSHRTPDALEALCTAIRTIDLSGVLAERRNLEAAIRKSAKSDGTSFIPSLTPLYMPREHSPRSERDVDSGVDAMFDMILSSALSTSSPLSLMESARAAVGAAIHLALLDQDAHKDDHDESMSPSHESAWEALKKHVDRN